MTSIKNLKSALRNNLSLAILCLAVLAAVPVHAETGGGRTVKYSQQDIVPVHAKGTRTSGSSTGRTTSATFIRRRPEFAPTFTSSPPTAMSIHFS